MNKETKETFKNFSLFIIITISSFFMIQIGYNSYLSYKEDRLSEEARKIYVESRLAPPSVMVPTVAPEPLASPATLTPSASPVKLLQPEFHALRDQYNNDDIMGYLKIDNTSIDYPVLQFSDNDFYLNKGIDKNINVAGSIYLDYENNIENDDKNTIIYGHNMKQDIMFHSLRYYVNEHYYKDRKYITFNTAYDNYKWEVFSFYMTEDSFYYLDVNFDSDDDFMALVNEMKQKSYYDTGVDVTKEDRILTLSTCTNITDTTRYVLNAKLVEVNGIPYSEYLKGGS